MAVSILDMTREILNKPEGDLNGQDFEDAGLPMIGGCEVCGATIAAYNAYPSTSGFLRCSGCLYDEGWDDVKAAIDEIFAT